MSMRTFEGWRLVGKDPGKRYGTLKDEDKETFDLGVDHIVEAYRHMVHGEQGAERQGYIILNSLEHAFFVEWTEDEMSAFRKGLVPIGGV